jgi:hypothetical protein
MCITFHDYARDLYLNSRTWKQVGVSQIYFLIFLNVGILSLLAFLFGLGEKQMM